MTTRKRVAHTASFLQTFHTGQTTAARREAAGAEGSEPRPAAPEAAAVAFVKTGRSAKFADFNTDRSYVAEYSGIKVKHGEGLITELQAKYVVSIALQREGVTEAMLESLKARLVQGFAKNAASQFISTYKDLPRKQVAPSPARESFLKATHPVVAEGRYAVEEEGVLKFFRVSHGKGQWTGRIFVEVQASDDRYPLRNAERRNLVLRLIAEAPEAAAVRYGQELGHCYRCGRTLTDATSRDMGIGPDCRAK